MSVKTVLIADDEAEIVELASAVINNGHSMLAAYDGEQALRLIGEHRPDLVLTDIMMPRLDGIELCRRIRSNATTRSTKIVVMTAAAAFTLRDCGADELIRKPFDIYALEDTVLRLLDDDPHVT